jgi:hypothetical protein
MARRGDGAWSKYRGARARLAELETLRDQLQRTRPRTRGKKAAKTRALNKLARQIPAVKGLLTKARNAIAKTAAARTTGKKTSRSKRSEAAKRGWATRRARKPSAPAVAPSAPAPSGKLAMPHLTIAKGVVGVWPPSKDDRSKEGQYWGTVDRLFSNQPASFERFEGDSIFDEISGKRLPFVTDLDVIYAHHDEYLFGLTFYRNRHEYERFA